MFAEGFKKYRQALKNKSNNKEMPKDAVAVALRKPMVVSFMKGGKVNKTGMYLLHKGEVVVPKEVMGRKGTPSKTMPGKLDFTTKKGSKDFNRGGKRQTTKQGSKTKSTPYKKK
jgi:hypothetical protein